jgi:hypothetical protein
MKEHAKSKCGKSRMARKDEDSSMKNIVLLWTIILACILFSYSRAYSAIKDKDTRRSKRSGTP